MVRNCPLMHIFEFAPREFLLHKIHEGLDVRGFPRFCEGDPSQQGVALTKFVLQMLSASQASELSIDHDG